MNNRFKNILINLSVLAVTLLVVFLLVEAGFRIFYQPAGLFYQSDPYIGQIHVPNFSAVKSGKEYNVEIKINQHGFVGPDYEYEKEENVWRAVMLGDSFVEAMQVVPENNFSSLIEESLNQHLPGQYEVINMGVGNFGTVRSYNNLKYYGLKYQPDLVILAFFIGNDITDNYMEQEEIIIKDGREKKNWRQYFKSLILNNFRSAQYIRDRSNTSVPLRRFFIKLGLLSELKQLANTGEGQGSINFKYHIYLNEDTDIYKEGWDKTKEYLKKIKELSQKNRIDFLVVLIPSRDQIYSDSWNEVRDNFPELKSVELDLERPQRELAAYMTEAGIGYLDLTPRFKEIASTSKDNLYYTFDGHFSPFGHEQAGQLIYDYLMGNYFFSTTTTKFINNKIQ